MHLEERDRPAERELAHVEEERLVVRHQVLPPQRQREGVRLDDEEDHELRGEGADADEAAARAEELHERHRVLPERVRVLVADRPRRAAGGVARRRVGGEQRAEDDDDVRRVDRLGLEALLRPRDHHRGDRAAREDDRVQPKLGPDARALLDPLRRDVEDERRAREHQVHREARRREQRAVEPQVLRVARHRGDADRVVREHREPAQLVHVELVLAREQALAPLRERRHDALQMLSDAY